jgi:predicted RNA-binding Zn-ribbon protein involved in translation (DUF1610 family)
MGDLVQPEPRRDVPSESATAFCPQCGSVHIVRSRATLLDRQIERLVGLRRFFCRRCGWRGRQNWPDATIVDPAEYLRSHDLRDPSLKVLDRFEKPAKLLDETTLDQIGLGFQNEHHDAEVPANNTEVAQAEASHSFDEDAGATAPQPGPRPYRKSRTGSTRREIIRAVLLTAVALAAGYFTVIGGGCETTTPVD